MALSVAKPKAQPKLKVTTAKGGLQSSTYNPQQAASGKTVQNANYNPQKTAPAPQATFNPQAAAIAASQAAQAAAIEVARIREQTKQIFTHTLNGKITINTQALTSTVKKNAPALKVAPVQAQRKILVPKDERSEYQKAYDSSYAKAQSDSDAKSKAAPKTGLSKLWDKVSLGSERRQAGARGYADKKSGDVAKTQVKTYEKNLDGFLKAQAARKSEIEKTKFQSQSAYDRATSDYDKWQQEQINILERARGSVTGASEGYVKYGQKALTTKAAKLFAKVNTATDIPTAALSNVFKYTLGGGSKNAPSLVTAPGRAINTLGNLNTKDRKIYLEGGGSSNRTKSGDNAWQASFNQRNINLRPQVDHKFTSAELEKKWGKLAATRASSYQQTGVGTKNKQLGNKDYWLKKFADDDNRNKRNLNSALVNVADPLLFLGGASKSGAVGSAATKLVSGAKATKLVQWSGKAAAAATSNKYVKWLGEEHKTPNQKLADAIAADKTLQGELQQDLLPQVRQLQRSIKESNIDYGVFDELEKLTDGQAKALQRMVSGKLALGDRIAMVGNKSGRNQLVQLAERYKKFSTAQAGADDITENSSRFINSKKQYFANTNWIPRKGDNILDKYNFRRMKKKNTIQSAADLKRSQVDRFFKSSYDEKVSGKITKEKQQLNDLIKSYDDQRTISRDAIDVADKKTRTPFNRARFAVNKVSPIAIWKKSVLKYRPAWYVNNTLYNTQAAYLAGGSRALTHQAKMLIPGNYSKALKSVPENVRADVASEVGKGKLAKFGNRVENWSRMAAYMGAKDKGLSDADALKRTNRYLFDYKTKNYERPIKAVVPFYQFQKSLTKAAVSMPLDRPGAAIAYNRLDDKQKQQLNDQFNAEVVPEMKKLGATDAEIEKARADQAKYYGGKLRLPNGKYINTPFVASSDKGLSNFGINPYISAASEISTGKDQYGRTLGGRDSSISKRLISKFPQAQIATEGISKALIKAGKLKPSENWIGKPGSEGYGMSKSAQGYDSSKTNYRKSLDSGSKFNQNLSAFFGAPRSSEFDSKTFIDRERMKRVKTAYFSLDTTKMKFEDGEAARDAIFKKYGVTADQFYKGELSKYDTDSTKSIKQLKAEAREKTSKLFKEYGEQPKGSRSVWSTQRLRELNASGYFDKNPFLKSFDWSNPDTIKRADKTLAYRAAKASGNWSDYNKAYGDTRKKSAFKLGDKHFKSQASLNKYKAANDKYIAAQAAVKSGKWDDYRAKYGTKETPFNADGKYFKSVETMAKYKAGKFWDNYSKSSKFEQTKLLAAHPEYNTRGGWTAADWLDWRAHKSDDIRLSARTRITGFTAKEAEFKYFAKIKAAPVLAKKGIRSRNVKVAYGLPK